jgi:hypothetical protein
MTMLPRASSNLLEPNKGHWGRFVIVECSNQTPPPIEEEAPFQNTVNLKMNKNMVRGPSQAQNQV